MFIYLGRDYKNFHSVLKLNLRSTIEEIIEEQQKSNEQIFPQTNY
jgi:hypothetical protein